MTTDAPQAQTDRYQCPVCLWNTQDGPIRAHKICPCCGTQYGYASIGPLDYLLHPYSELREEWLKSGGKWWVVEAARSRGCDVGEGNQPIPEFVEGRLGPI
jgi:hypothetical protein